MAQLEYMSSRLVRGVAAAAGRRAGFGDAAATEVVSARSVSAFRTACPALSAQVSSSLTRTHTCECAHTHTSLF